MISMKTILREIYYINVLLCDVLVILFSLLDIYTLVHITGVGGHLIRFVFISVVMGSGLSLILAVVSRV